MDHETVYDTARSCVLLFGGETQVSYGWGPPIGDTWELRGVPPSPATYARFGAPYAKRVLDGLEDLDVDTVRISINEVLIAEKGARAATYSEAAGSTAMASRDLRITVDLGRGGATETIWTSDFSYDYVRINAEYRS